MENINTNQDIEANNIPPSPLLEVVDEDEERGVSILDNTNTTKVSAVTFGSDPNPVFASDATTTTRRINRKDVKAVFKASTTTAAASHEQIARIRKMHQKISEGVDWVSVTKYLSVRNAVMLFTYIILTYVCYFELYRILITVCS